MSHSITVTTAMYSRAVPECSGVPAQGTGLIMRLSFRAELTLATKKQNFHLSEYRCQFRAWHLKSCQNGSNTLYSSVGTFKAKTARQTMTTVAFSSEYALSTSICINMVIQLFFVIQTWKELLRSARKESFQ